MDASHVRTYASRHYICVVERSNPQPFAGGGAAGEVGAAEKGQRQYGNAQQGDQGEGRAMKPKRLAESAERAPHTPRPRSAFGGTVANP